MLTEKAVKAILKKPMYPVAFGFDSVVSLEACKDAYSNSHAITDPALLFKFKEKRGIRPTRIKASTVFKEMANNDAYNIILPNKMRLVRGVPIAVFVREWGGIILVANKDELVATMDEVLEGYSILLRLPQDNYAVINIEGEEIVDW